MCDAIRGSEQLRWCQDAAGLTAAGPSVRLTGREQQAWWGVVWYGVVWGGVVWVWCDSPGSGPGKYQTWT